MSEDDIAPSMAMILSDVLPVYQELPSEDVDNSNDGSDDSLERDLELLNLTQYIASIDKFRLWNTFRSYCHCWLYLVTFMYYYYLYI